MPVLDSNLQLAANEDQECHLPRRDMVRHYIPASPAVSDREWPLAPTSRHPFHPIHSGGAHRVHNGPYALQDL